MSRPLIKKKKGFASMSRERLLEVSSQGGKATSAQGTAHKFTSVEAAAAGRKGGIVVAANREHMATIGKVGGKAISSNKAHMVNIAKRGGHLRRMKSKGR